MCRDTGCSSPTPDPRTPRPSSWHSSTCAGRWCSTASVSTSRCFRRACSSTFANASAHNGTHFNKRDFTLDMRARTITIPPVKPSRSSSVRRPNSLPTSARHARNARNARMRHPSEDVPSPRTNYSNSDRARRPRHRPVAKRCASECPSSTAKRTPAAAKATMPATSAAVRTNSIFNAPAPSATLKSSSAVSVLGCHHPCQGWMTSMDSTGRCSSRSAPQAKLDSQRRTLLPGNFSDTRGRRDVLPGRHDVSWVALGLHVGRGLTSVV